MYCILLINTSKYEAGMMPDCSNFGHQFYLTQRCLLTDATVGCGGEGDEGRSVVGNKGLWKVERYQGCGGEINKEAMNKKVMWMEKRRSISN